VSEVFIEEEIWLPVVGYEKTYEVSSLGRVRRSAPGRSTKPGRVLKQFPIWKAGHLGVSLCQNGKQKTFAVHKLVTRAWIGPMDWKQQVHHIDTVCTNNRADNLEYTSARENWEEQWHRRMTEGIEEW
jgi:hypothetical protein